MYGTIHITATLIGRGSVPFAGGVDLRPWLRYLKT
jgi:hypothetical protein